MSWVRQSETDQDIFVFQHDFLLEPPEGKAVVTEEANGDLTIEGYAAVFDGLDREGENFAEGAFPRGIQRFLTSQAALCYHHKADVGVGNVLHLEEHKGKGLWMRGRVDYQPETSPWRHIYNGVKKGTFKGLSIGGFFKRIGNKIVDVDFTEISITPVPIHPGTNFAVVAGKALATDIQKPDDIEIPKVPRKLREEDLFVINESLRMLADTFAKLNSRGEKKDDNSPNLTVDTPFA